MIDEIEMLFDELNLHINFFDTKTTLISFPVLCDGKFEFYKKIEKFIAIINKYNSNIFRCLGLNNTGNFTYSATPLSQMINPFDFLYIRPPSAPSDEYPLQFPTISKNVQLFMQLLWEYNSNNQATLSPDSMINNTNVNPVYPQPIQDIQLSDRQKHQINNFAFALKSQLHSEENQYYFNETQRKTNQKYKDFCIYFDHLIQKFDDLTFISFDFCLGTDGSLIEVNTANGEKKNILTFKAQFLNNARNIDPLSRMVGYMGKWEYNNVQGLYFRMILIFPTNKVGDIKTLQYQIDNYWCDTLTLGVGLSHHSHIASYPKKYRKSFCKIKAGQSKDIELFKQRTIGYLTKSEKYYNPPEIRQRLNDLSQSKESSRETSIVFKSKIRKN